MSQQTYKIGNMDCANCAKELEAGVGKLSGVNGVRVDFPTQNMMIDGDVPYATLQQRVEALGKTIITDDDQKTQTQQRGGVLGFVEYLLRQTETRLAVIGGTITLTMLVLSLLFDIPGDITAVVYTGAMLIALYPIARQGLNTLRINREFNINLLMTIAAIGAIIIGEYLEASTVIFLFAIGEALEGYTTDRARRSLSSLLDLRPDEAVVIREGQAQTVATEDVQVEETVLVKPGERIPVDGVITEGESSINQAPITGESVPVYKTTDDEVFAGTLNGDGALHIRTTRRAEDNTLSRIIHLVEEAQSARAPSQRIIDRFAHYYTPAVTIFALLVATVPPLVFGQPFFDTADGHGWFYRALAILVIACPCALVISTPVTVISAITAAARNGVLIKGGAHLEALGKVKVIAFDKTGTLTHGEPRVVQIHSIDCETDGDLCTDCTDVLGLAAAIEEQSTHPLARAVMDASEQHAIGGAYGTAQNVQNISGRGVRGQLDGKWITVGSHQLFEEQFQHDAALCTQIDSAEANGETAMLLHDGDRVRGFITMADKIREDSKAVIAMLNQRDMQTVMLTGDNAQVAQAVGAEVGVSDVRAELLPEDKLKAIEGLLIEHEYVAMVGDGINDAPALAASTVGIAMGGAGSAQALETADIALLADDLKQLPFGIRLARLARRLIKQNVALTFAVKGLFLLLALFGMTTLWLAVLADVGMSLLVTLNGMRPLRQRE